MNTIDKSTNEDELSRREFLRTSLVTSVAATAVGMAAMGESTAVRAESKTENSSIITVTGAQAAPTLRKPWKNAISQLLSVKWLEPGHAVTADELQQCERAQGGQLRQGDILGPGITDNALNLDRGTMATIVRARQARIFQPFSCFTKERSRHFSPTATAIRCQAESRA